MMLNTCLASMYRRIGSCRSIRNFSICENKIDITAIPLTESLLSYENSEQNSTFKDEDDVRISTLKNGLKIASLNKFGMQCALGVMISAGPRFEYSTKGVSHFIEKLGFHSTINFKNRDEIQGELEKCSAIFDCQTTRDFVVYAVSGLNTQLDCLTNVLSETVLRPRISQEEVNMAERAIGFELATLQMAPPVEPILNEMLHSAAYGNSNTLGKPKYCPAEILGSIKRADILTYMASLYRPERAVLAGVGVNHDHLVECAEKNFGLWNTTYGEEIKTSDRFPILNTAPKYIGTELTVDRDLSQYHAPMPEFAHCVLGFSARGTREPGFVTTCLLNSLLGGGGSFSAGGPGKGMYTRLYTNVLNECHWVNSAQSTNHAYSETGIFAVSGSAQPDNLDNLVQVLIGELRNTAEAPISSGELARAKRQLESMLLQNLEMRPVVFEDIARQVLSTGQWRNPDYWVEQINKVTVDDLRELLSNMLKTQPTLVGYGRMQKWPKYQKVIESLTERRSLSSRMPSIFRRFV